MGWSMSAGRQCLASGQLSANELVPEIILPNNWEPRPYQQNLWNYLINGGKRAVAIWHRRAGKDDLCLHWTACAAMKRPGNYWHLLPQANQARKAIWDAVNPHTGIRRIFEAFPEQLLSRDGGYRENEMQLRFANGSTWQLVGSDNFQSLIGSPPVGLTFSEWALCDPAAWAYLSPILRENDGWAVFITTPRGRNHAFDFYQEGTNNPDWFAELLPADKTGVFSTEALDQERAELVRVYGADQGKSIFESEYMVSFQAGLIGAYYGTEMEQAERDKRITNVPHDPRVPVWTSWDLGMADASSIWCLQLVGKEIRAIDYIEQSGVGMDWYARELQKRNFTFAGHLLPHDANVRELGTGKSRVEILRSLGISARVVPAQSVADGINATRMLIPSMWFDKTKCKRGIECLQRYRRSWDDKRKIYNDRPFHDEFSHGADSLRTFAMSNVRNPVKRQINYSNKGIV
jgi:phage terminase large subunit